MFILFAKYLPTVAISDEKELSAGLLYAPEPENFIPKKEEIKISSKETGLLAIFNSPGALVESLRKMRENGYKRLETFSPFRIDEVNSMLHPRKSPVRFWTLTGAILGCIGGFWLAIGSAYVNDLYVGGKYSPAAYIPYCIAGFEGLILIGALSNLAGMIFYARLGRIKLPDVYDRRFSKDNFGLFVACNPGQMSNVKTILSSFNPEEINAIE
jgi:molybdopterin-containing oxidoreductase family membrane subunit